jgi:hypothetical protein
MSQGGVWYKEHVSPRRNINRTVLSSAKCYTEWSSTGNCRDDPIGNGQGSLQML